LVEGACGLDYGSGPGPTLSVMLEERGFVMRNYDPFFADDVDALAGEYDFIACTETVEHFHHPGREFQCFDRLLRPGGWLGIMTGMRDPGTDFADWYYVRDPTHVSFYQMQTMEWLAQHFNWILQSPGPNVVLFQVNPNLTGPGPE
ncbi:MAG: class I SAM-dependent methyltransferase, partial [Gammaproteobacteria bacterium]